MGFQVLTNTNKFDTFPEMSAKTFYFEPTFEIRESAV